MAGTSHSTFLRLQAVRRTHLYSSGWSGGCRNWRTTGARTFSSWCFRLPAARRSAPPIPLSAPSTRSPNHRTRGRINTYIEHLPIDTAMLRNLLVKYSKKSISISIYIYLSIEVIPLLCQINVNYIFKNGLKEFNLHPNKSQYKESTYLP